MRLALAALALLAVASSATAQRRAPRAAEPPSEADRAFAEGAAAVAEGRLPDAFAAFHRATEHAPDDASAWRALAEVAERLRVDEVALHAYARYLELAPDADDRPEIEGRVRSLEQLARGARFVAHEEGETVRLVVDWDGEAVVSRHVRRRAGSNVLVDWQGRPLRVRRSSELLSLAEWDGTLRSDDAEIPTELMPFPSTVARRGLGRRLGSP